MMLDLSFEDAVAKADSLLDLGHKNVWLRYGAEDYPWHIAETVKAGNSYRMSMPTCFQVTGEHESGLEFSWSVDIEPREANGTGTFQIDSDRLLEIAARLPASPRAQLAVFLQEVADLVEKKG